MSVRSNYNGTFEPLRNAVYKYFTWLSIPDNTVKTEELTAPRIRDAPDAPEVPSLQIQNGNFAKVKNLNLPYQELAQEYQLKKFIGILKQNGNSAKLVHLQGNRLKTLKTVEFLQADRVYLQHNLLPSFSDLPKMEKVTHIYLQDNCIDRLDKIKNLPAGLQSLDLSRNPVTFTIDYRKTVFRELPGLIYLDGVVKLPEDE